MKILSWTLALAATWYLAAFAPASAATVTYTGTDIAYDIMDLGGGEYDGFADGEVTDGVDTFDFFASAFVNPIDPPDGTLLITKRSGDKVLDGLLESIDVGTDYVALIFGDLDGSAAASFGGKARVVFTDISFITGNRVAALNSLSSVSGNASVTIAPVPLPATALLLLSGMAGVVVIARRRKAPLTRA